ncbi:hypothetical protein [Pikeienuella sp. HZG-20]|uniref:hypothetical protein n=1 Tax=Paludibacillus litoralis TaxID=3133267 RepID=UPI0030ED7A8D
MRPGPLAATLLALSIAAGFSWIAARPWTQAPGAPPPPRPAAAPEAPDAPPPAPAAPPQATDLSDFTRRPLFSAARRPPPPETPGIAVEAPAPDLLFGRYEIAGVVVLGESALALLRDSDGKLIRLRAGDRIPAGGPGAGEARITEISLDSLTFTHQGATVTAPVRREGAKTE